MANYQEFIDLLKNIPKNDVNDLIPLEKFLELNISNIDKEREKMRELFKNKNIVVQIKCFGKVFDIKWNINMDKCTIVIPSRYKIEIDQSLLLDLYSNKFLSEKKEDDPDKANIEKLASSEQHILLEGYDAEQLYEEDDYDKIMEEIVSIESIDNNPNKIKELLELYQDIDLARNFIQKALSLTRKDTTALLHKYLPKLELTEEECHKYGINKYKKLFNAVRKNITEDSQLPPPKGRGL